MSVVLALADQAETAALARLLAERARPGEVLALAGALGSGKTTLARAFIRALTSADEEVPSPTFTLLQSYDGATGPIHHFDLYRLKTPDEALELGLDDALADGITLIEWPERLGSMLPPDHLSVTLAAGEGPDGRRVMLAGPPAWTTRLEEIAKAWTAMR